MTTTKTRPAPTKGRRARATAVPAGAISKPFDATVGIARQCDALTAAWQAGVLTRAEYQAKLKPLTARLHASAKADETRMGALGPLGVTIGTTVVVTGEPIETAWGNQVRADLLALNAGKLELSGGTLTGPLTLPGNVTVTAGSVVVQGAGNGVALPAGQPSAADRAARKDYVDTAVALRALLAGDTFTGDVIVNTAGTPLTLKRTGDAPFLELQSVGGTMLGRLVATVSALQLVTPNDLTFQDTNTERMRLRSAALLFGKTVSSLDSDGVEIYGTGSGALGSMRTTISSSSLNNLYARHMGAADANTVQFAGFTRTSAATQIGSITQVNTTGVAFNTASDRELKTDRGPIADALAALRKRAPRLATYKGVKGAAIEMVFYADDWLDISGVAVPRRKLTRADVAASGVGKVGDVVPAQMDYGRTNPLIAAAVLELAERLDRLERRAA